MLDPQFGNLWTNIPAREAKLTLQSRYEVHVVAPGGSVQFNGAVPFVRTFAEVPINSPLLYVNSIGNLALALNQTDFAERFGVASGPGWRVTVGAGSEAASP